MKVSAAVKGSLNHAGGDNLPASGWWKQVEPTLLEHICRIKTGTVMLPKLKKNFKFRELAQHSNNHLNSLFKVDKVGWHPNIGE